jgi:hypothetical protein
MKIYRIAQIENEYLLEQGMLYDSDAEDVFSFKELLDYKVPLFKSPTEANEFLAQIEQATGRQFGRVPDRDFMTEIRYKDTRKEKEVANKQDRDERNKRWQKGEF